MAKRVCIFILTLSLFLGGTLQSFAFTDANSHWAKGHIDWASSNQLMKGYPDGSFEPDRSMTKAEYYTVINAILGVTTKEPITFTDVTAGDWYYEEVQKGVSAGYLQNTRSPLAANANITRDEAARILSYVYKFPHRVDKVESFRDKGNIVNKGAVGALVFRGIFNGYPDGTFGPTKSITRGEMSKVLQDSVKNYGYPKSTKTTPKTYTPNLSIDLPKAVTDNIERAKDGSAGKSNDRDTYYYGNRERYDRYDRDYYRDRYYYYGRYYDRYDRDYYRDRYYDRYYDRYDRDRYDRNYRDHRVYFDTNGGVLDGPAYRDVYHYDKVYEPKEPTRKGYKFEYWTKDGVRYDFDKPVRYDFTLEAKFVKEDEKDKEEDNKVDDKKDEDKKPEETPKEEGEKEEYTVTFDLKGGKSDRTKIKVKKGEKVSKPQDPQKEGTQFKFWSLDGRAFDFEMPIEKDITLVAIYQDDQESEREKIRIDFDKRGGENFIPSQMIYQGDLVPKPKVDPSKRGAKFKYWSLDYKKPIEYKFDQPLFKPTTIYAIYDEVPALDEEEVVVRFKLDGGEDYTYQVLKSGEKVDRPKDPQIEGCTFKYWTLDSIEYDFEQTLSESVTLVGVFTENPHHKVTFDAKGGTPSPDMQKVEIGKLVKTPTPPTKEGYEFVEWTLDGKTFDFKEVIDRDVTLEAKYREKKEIYYTVTFDAKEGKFEDGKKKIAVKVKEKESIKEVQKPKNPQKEGHIFSYWTLDGKVYDFKNKVEKDIELEANYNKKDTEKYTVSFIGDDGKKIEEQTIEKGQKATKRNGPIKDGYEFIGWYVGEEAYDFNEPVTKDIILKASYKEKSTESQEKETYTITFNAGGGTFTRDGKDQMKVLTIEKDSSLNDKKMNLPVPISPQGMIFAGWENENKEEFRVDSKVDKDLKLNAKYIPSENAVNLRDLKRQNSEKSLPKVILDSMANKEMEIFIYETQESQDDEKIKNLLRDLQTTFQNYDLDYYIYGDTLTSSYYVIKKIEQTGQTSTEKYTYYVTVNYTKRTGYTYDNAQKTKKEIKKWVKENIKDKNITGDEEKVKLIHDAIINKAKYTEGVNDLNEQGLGVRTPDAIVLGEGGVCEAYAKLFDMMAKEAGLESKYVTGEVTIRKTGKKESHAWNVVKVGNEWYHIDTTFDDPSHNQDPSIHTLSYTYYLLSTEDIKKNSDQIRTIDDEAKFKKLDMASESYKHNYNSSRRSGI